MVPIGGRVVMNCATKLPWHDVHFRLFEFWVFSKLWVSLLLLMQGSRSFPTPRWWLYPWHEPLSAVSIKPEESKAMLMFYQLLFQARKLKLLCCEKHTEICLCVHIMAEEQNERSDQKCSVKVLFTSNINELALRVREGGQAWWWTAIYPCSVAQILSGIQCFSSTKYISLLGQHMYHHSWVSIYTPWGGIYVDSGVVYAVYTHLFFYVMLSSWCIYMDYSSDAQPLYLLYFVLRVHVHVW